MPFDLYIKGKEEDDIDGFRYFTTGFNRSVGVRGPMKLSIQWMKRFLTTKGADPAHPEYGTEFPNLIGSNITNTADTQDVVMLAITDCNEQVFSSQRETPPEEDEQLASATLTRFDDFGADGFDADVTIKNVAGDLVTINLPDLATRT